MPSAEKLHEDIRVGARIRELRTQRGLRLVAFAAQIGCSKGHLSNIESGRSTARPDLRAAAAEALGVTLEDIEAYPQEVAS
jgi:transcriptional regulator with XRE-family HTH domain